MKSLGYLSSKQHHGLQLIIGLAQSYHTGKPISLAEVSLKGHMSLKYLEQLVTPFRKAGWLKSQRGRVGGYLLTRDPKEISLKGVMDLLQESTALVFCLESNGSRCCVFEKKCASRKAWKKVQDALDESLRSIRLADLL